MTLKPAIALSTAALALGGAAFVGVTANGAAKPNAPATTTVEFSGAACVALKAVAAKNTDKKITYRFPAGKTYCFKTISK